MKTITIVAGIFALSVAAGALGPAQGKDHGAGMSMGASGHATGLARADVAAGTHGMQGRAIARTRGSHVSGFCPPGQRKKAGLGSRFRC